MTEAKTPVCYVLTICWNEANFLPYFLDYYSFAKKIIVFDNMSSDNSVKIMKEYKNVEISHYNTNEQIRDDIYLEIKNHAWKQFRNECDWFIIVDIDEIVYHPDGILNYLNTVPEHIGVIQSKGFEMFSPNFNQASGKTLFEKSIVGMPGSKLNKCNIIRSKMVYDINYMPGCHEAYPKMNFGILHSDPNVKLLHYKFIMPLEYMVARYKTMASRLSIENKKGGYGFHYSNMNSLHKKYIDISNGHKPVISQPLPPSPPLQPLLESQ